MQCGLVSLLLAIFIGGLVFWKNHDAIETATPGVYLAQEKPSEIKDAILTGKVSESATTPFRQISNIVPAIVISSVNPIITDTIHIAETLPAPSTTENPTPKIKEEEISVAESPVTANEDSIMPAFEDEPLYAYIDDEPFRESRSSGWSLNAGMSTGITNFESFGLTQYDDDADNLDDNLFYVGSPILAGSPGGAADNPYNQNENLPTRAISKVSFSDYEYANHRHYLPNSFYATVNKEITTVFSIETGLAYTYLHSTFELNDTKSSCHWHYLGIPLKFNFTLKNGNRFKLYTSLGAKVDFPLYSNAVTSHYENRPSLKSGKFNSSVVWSTSISLGASVKIFKNAELFVEPTLNYHFKHDYTVPNILTEEPWGVSIPVGIRFNLNK